MTARFAAVLLLVAASLSIATPLSRGIHIGDSIAQVDSLLGRRYKTVPAIKMTDNTRKYERDGRPVYVSFKGGKVCSLWYTGDVAAAEAMTLLSREAPEGDWQLERTVSGNGNVIRFYHTSDRHLVAHVQARSVLISTREVEY